jgi:hypothetical protein
MTIFSGEDIYYYDLSEGGAANYYWEIVSPDPQDYSLMIWVSEYDKNPI